MGGLSKLNSKGQLTIPKDIRDELELSSGMEFYVVIQDDRVIAIPKNKSIADLAGILGKPPNGKGFTIEEIDEAIMDAVAEDDRRISREWHEGRK